MNGIRVVLGSLFLMWTNQAFAEFTQMGIGQDFTSEKGQIRDGYAPLEAGRFTKDDRFEVFIDWQSPVGAVPNIKFQYTAQQESLSFQAQRFGDIGGMSFEQSDTIISDARGGHADLTFYWNLINRRTDFDVGVTFYYLNFNTNVSNLTTQQQKSANFSVSQPCIYVGFGFDVDDKWRIAVDADIFYAFIDASTDFTAKIKYQSDYAWGGEFGFRFDDLQSLLDDSHTVYSRYQGVFTNLTYRF